jgi:hypothetical protein
MQRATRMCVSVCTGLTNGDAFSITTPPAVLAAGGIDDAANADAIAAAANSAVGTTVFDPLGPPVNSFYAVCLYDYLLISGGRDSNNVEADRYCGNGLNPAVGTALLPGALTSTQVCSK